MLDALWNLVKVVCGPFVFLAKVLASCWKAMWWIASKVFSILTFLAPPGIAAWLGTNWLGTKSVISAGDNHSAQVDIETVFTDSEGHMKTHAEQLTMPMDDFENRDFSALSGEMQEFDDEISQILRNGDAVSFQFGSQ